MYYIMLKFPFLYVGLRKTIKDILKLVGEKTGKNPVLSNCLNNRHPISTLEFFQHLPNWFGNYCWKISNSFT